MAAVSQSQTVTQSTTKAKADMEETLTLVLHFQDRIENGDPPTQAEQDEVIRHFSDLAMMMSSGAVITGEMLATLGHLLEVADLIKYGFDLTMLGAPILLLHLTLRFWLLNRVSRSVDVSEAKLDEWNDMYTGPHGELTTAERTAKASIDKLGTVVKRLVSCTSGNIPPRISLSMRNAVKGAEHAMEEYTRTIQRSQQDLNVVLGAAQDSHARVTSSRNHSVGGVVSSSVVVVASGAAVIATGGLAAIVGLAVGVVGVAGNGYALNRSEALMARGEDLFDQIEQNQRIIHAHREKYDNMVKQIQDILYKAADTIRREQSFLDQRAKAERAEADAAIARAKADRAEAEAAELRNGSQAKDAELEQLRRMLAKLQSGK